MLGFTRNVLHHWQKVSRNGFQEGSAYLVNEILIYGLRVLPVCAIEIAH